MIRFLRSFIFFLRLLVAKKYVDVILYAPQHFNRGKDGSNEYFRAIIDALESNNISYISFDEPDYITKSRNNKDGIPFDFMYLVILISRRLYSAEMNCIIKDQKIGSFLSKTFLRNLKFKNYIVLSQSMLSVFRGINNNAKLFDLQHGIIHSDKETYIDKEVASSNILVNQVNLLLYGKGFRNLLCMNEESGYFSSHSFVIGSQNKQLNYSFEKNKNILVSLQFTNDHSVKKNSMLEEELEQLIITNSSFNFYLKDHPRFNNEVSMSGFFQYDNVFKAKEDLFSNFSLCSLHLTAYSTTTFECAEFGIPTIFLESLKDEFDMFEKDFKYPFKVTLSDAFQNYEKYSDEVIKWRKEFYSDFDEQKFISLLK